MVCHVKPKSLKLDLLGELDCLTRYQNLVWFEEA